MSDSDISQQAHAQIAARLSHLLAESYVLYLKTQNFHWNVTGPQFAALHTLFEQQYTELAAAVDEIAERIRALGLPAPGSWEQFSELSSIQGETGVPSANDMIRQLLGDQETITKTARAALPVATEANDEGSADLLTHRIQTHEKNAWMLRSLLE